MGKGSSPLKEWVFVIPGNPVGVNQAWAKGRHGIYMTAIGRRYKEAVVEKATEAGVELIEGGRWRVAFVYSHKGPRSRCDVDAPIKLALDSLQGVSYPNDADVVQVSSEKVRDPKLGNHVKVTLTLLGREESK